MKAIRRYWREVWSHTNEGYEPAERERDLLQPIREQFAGVKWAHVPKDKKVKIVRSAKGSAGVDGWTGDEISWLPKAVIHLALDNFDQWKKPVTQVRVCRATSCSACGCAASTSNQHLCLCPRRAKEDRPHVDFFIRLRSHKAIPHVCHAVP